MKILLLWPFSLLYGVVVVIRNLLYDCGFWKPLRVGIPVISVGNLVAGGTGKTPCVLMLANLLWEMGHRPAIVSRGYRRRRASSGPLLVSDGSRILCTPDHSGDEPYLLAKKLIGKGISVIVSTDRLAGARMAEECGAEVIILDDGFQHRRLGRDLDILLLDCRKPFDNGWLLPAGMLREPRSAIKRAGMIMFTRCESKPFPDPNSHLGVDIPILTSRHVPGPLWTIDSWRLGAAEVSPETIDRPVMLFSGLAQPESFEQSVSQLGLRIAGHLKYPDHHRYHPADLKMIEKEGRATGLLLTTEKDAVKLPDDWHPKSQLYVLGVSVQLTFPDQMSILRDFIMERISHR